MPRRKNEVATIQQRQVSADVQTVMALIEKAAMDKDFPLDRLERLLKLRDDVIAKDNQDAFNEQMAFAQKEMEPIVADSRNDSTKSNFASYPALDRAVRPIYSKYGFSLSFDTEDLNDKPMMMRVVCYVTCCKHTRKYHIDIPTDGKGPQGGDVMTKTHATGSGASYGQRYLVRMIFNLAVDRDDDGNKAGKVQLETVTDDQLKGLQARIKAAAVDLPKFLALFKIKTLDQLPAALFDEASKQIARKEKAQPKPQQRQAAPAL